MTPEQFTAKPGHYERYYFDETKVQRTFKISGLPKKMCLQHRNELHFQVAGSKPIQFSCHNNNSMGRITEKNGRVRKVFFLPQSAQTGSNGPYQPLVQQVTVTGRTEYGDDHSLASNVEVKKTEILLHHQSLRGTIEVVQLERKQHAAPHIKRNLKYWGSDSQKKEA